MSYGLGTSGFSAKRFNSALCHHLCTGTRTQYLPFPWHSEATFPIKHGKSVFWVDLQTLTRASRATVPSCPLAPHALPVLPSLSAQGLPLRLCWCRRCLLWQQPLLCSTKLPEQTAEPCRLSPGLNSMASLQSCLAPWLHPARQRQPLSCPSGCSPSVWQEPAALCVTHDPAQRSPSSLP